MYTGNHLSNHASTPSAPNFQGTKHLIRYLAGFPRLPVMYPSGLDGTNTHDFCQEVYPGEFQSQRYMILKIVDKAAPPVTNAP